MSALAYAAATLEPIDWALKMLVDVESKLAAVTSDAYMDGREDGARESPPPPGIAASVYHDRVSALFTPAVATLHAFRGD